MPENELGCFLRSRREAITPEQAGLVPGNRRRTPGLRRSELATLAGLSVEYLSRLEQGRDRNPSPPVLHALVTALQLSPVEAQLLHRAAKAAGNRDCPMARPPARQIRPTIQLLLEQFEATPAAVLNRAGEILAWTTGYEAISGPMGLLESALPSIPRFVFTDSRARTVYPDWDTVADRWSAELREGLSRPDPYVAELAEELSVTAGPGFNDRWNGPPVVPPRNGHERFIHPQAGELSLAYEVLELPDSDDQRLLVQLPADERTSSLLTQLTAVPQPTLRIVGG